MIERKRRLVCGGGGMCEQLSGAVFLILATCLELLFRGFSLTALANLEDNMIAK
jgi:hypothetical protein